MPYIVIGQQKIVFHLRHRSVLIPSPLVIVKQGTIPVEYIQIVYCHFLLKIFDDL